MTIDMFLSMNLIEQTYRRLTHKGEEILKLSVGNPTEEGFIFPIPILEEAYQRTLKHPLYHPHPKGLLQTREVIAHYYFQQGLMVDPEEILITSGTSESFFQILSLLTRPGDKILVPQPSYPLLEEIAKLCHVELIPYFLTEEEGWRINLNDLKEKLEQGPKALILISPHNPTGSVFTSSEILQIIEWTNSLKIPILCDEVFSEFCFIENGFPRIAKIGKPYLCFTLNGISKMFALPAFKLSWIAVSGASQKKEFFIDQLETINDTFLSCHIPIQMALSLLFEKGQDFLIQYQKEVKQRAEFAIQALKKIEGISVIPPQGGFYLTVKLENPNLSEEEWVIELMNEKKIFVHPGYFYDCGEGAHWILSFITQKEKLTEGIQRISDFVVNF